MSARSQRVGRPASTVLPSTLDQPGTIWLINHAKENLWKVHHWMELDDLINDGYVCFLSVVKRYPEVKSAAHRMALFQATFDNYIRNIARSKRYRRGEMNFGMFDDESLFQIEAIRCGYAELLVWFVEATDLARLALAAILEHPEEFRRKRRRKRRGGKTESLNDILCRLAGQDPKTVDLCGALKASVKT